jgi:hypothetical protein
MKMAVIWVAVPFGLAEVYQRFRGAFCLHHQGDNGGTHSPDDEGNKHWSVGNLGKRLPDYTAQQPR